MPIARLLLRRPDAPEAPQRLTINGRDYALLVRRHPRARTIRLRTDPAKGALLLTLPRHARLGEAIAFARTQAEWIEASFARAGTATPIAPGAVLPFRGTAHRIDWDAAHGRKVVAADGVIRLGGARDSVEPRLTRWLKAEARRLCAADLADYCARAGIATPSLALSSAARRWGSCSASGTIRINWRLILAPSWVRRATVAHEVAHRVHMNHAPVFHALVAELYGEDPTPARVWLRTHGAGLHWFGRSS